MSAAGEAPVAVVGAGPVGLTAALVLARAGVPVTVLEARPGLSEASRASTFHPATLDLLGELGVAGPLHRLGRTVDRIQWRDLDGLIHAELDYSLLTGATAHPHRLHVEQARLTPLLLAALEATGISEVRFGATVTGARQTGDGVRLTARHEQDGGRTHDSHHTYVLAADGSRSTLRDLAGLPATAREYPHYALRVVTREPLDELVPGLAPLSYVRDARQSFSVLGMADHWRLIFRMPRECPRADAVAPTAVRELLARALPNVGRTLPVADAHTYRLASFVLPRYRAGRVLFAGDAAHLTSTAGGMNMNCGLHDAVAVARTLADVLSGRADDGDLDATLDRRRAVVESSVIPRSEARTAGLTGAGALRRALDDVRRTAADPAAATDYLIKASLLDCAPRPRGATGQATTPTEHPAPTKGTEDPRNTTTSRTTKGIHHADLVSQAHR